MTPVDKESAASNELSFKSEVERFVVHARSLSMVFPTVTTALKNDAYNKAEELVNLVVSNSTELEFDRESKRLHMHGITCGANGKSV